MLEAALKYAELGYPVFPCVPGGKIPLTENGFLSATTDEETITQWWTVTPHANVAIPTAGLLVVDIDGDKNPWLKDDPEKLLDLARGPVGLTPRGGSHRIFRQPKGKVFRNTAGKIADRVDTRANGGYIVVSPSNLATGGGYRWAPGLELDAPRDRLPEPPEWLLALLESDRELLPSVRTNEPVPSNPIPSGQRNVALARLAGSMRRNGMSGAEIRAALQEANISRCCPPLEPIEVDRIVASITKYAPNQVAVATVEDHWSQLFHEIPKIDQPQDPGQFPEELLHPGGLLEMIMDFNLDGAYKPQPILALAAAIALVGTITGRKVADSTGTRTNIYCLGVGPSGCGKERARQVNKALLYEAGFGKMIGPEGIASHAGLVSAVDQQPAILFQLDEIGRFLQTIGSPGKAPHLYNVITVLMKLFTSSAGIYIGDAYADVKQTKQIYQPHACLYGTTVPKSLYEGLTADSITDGFLSRILIFETKDDPAPKAVKQNSLPRELIEQVQSWANITSKSDGNKPPGNLNEVNPSPIVMAYEPGAQDAIKYLEEVSHNEKQNKSDLSSLWTRTVEKARKLSLIHACSLGTTESIPQESAEWGCALSEFLTRKMLALANEWVSENTYERSRKRVLRIIKEYGPLSKTELYQRTRHLMTRERDEILQSLEASGEICRKLENTTGRSREVYHAT